jgi:hypothetical protein
MSIRPPSGRSCHAGGRGFESRRSRIAMLRRSAENCLHRSAGVDCRGYQHGYPPPLNHPDAPQGWGQGYARSDGG